jgi:hypothetical protein
MGGPERLAARIDYQHRVATGRLAAIQNIARKNPGMAGSDTACRFPVDAHCVQVPSLPWARSYFTGTNTGLLDAPLTLTTTG